jgi:hypothetical protein
MDIIYEYVNGVIQVSKLLNGSNIVFNNTIVNPANPPADLTQYKIVNRQFVQLTAQEITDATTQTRAERKAAIRAQVNQWLRQTDWILDLNNIASAGRKANITQFRIDVRTYVNNVQNTNGDPLAIPLPSVPANLDEV